MGNCFKTPSTDDISLLRGSDSQDGQEQPLGPPPPYQVRDIVYKIKPSDKQLRHCVQIFTTENI